MLTFTDLHPEGGYSEDEINEFENRAAEAVKAWQFGKDNFDESIYRRGQKLNTLRTSC